MDVLEKEQEDQGKSIDSLKDRLHDLELSVSRIDEKVKWVIVLSVVGIGMKGLDVFGPTVVAKAAELFH